MVIRWYFLLAVAALVLAGCSSTPVRTPSSDTPSSTRGLPLPSQPGLPRKDRDGPPLDEVDLASIPNAVPKFEPFSRYGNPPSYVVFDKRYYTQTSAVGYNTIGVASWYGSKFHGERTSSGEPYSMYAMTAAHKTLPLPTYARVTNLENNRSIIVKINDRGPFHEDRIIDLSYVAAAKLGYAERGTATVRVEAITFPQHGKAPAQAATQVASAAPERNQHYIQVGAFTDRDRAEALRDRLKSIHDSANVKSETTSRLPLFRVRLGPFSNREEAQQVAFSVNKFGLKSLIFTE